MVKLILRAGDHIQYCVTNWVVDAVKEEFEGKSIMKFVI